jgi:ATP-dependent RNA helicase DeaD
MPSFEDFNLQSATRAVLTNMEITEPTPIQAEAIPALLAGSDLVGQSATGSGKTLAYGIPLVERIARNSRVVQALVLVPTRELAVQVNAVLSKLATSRRLTTALLVGGRPYGQQISALRYGSQIVVGTPGRVKDHLERGTLVLNQLRMCVLDEADQMLDIGFAPAIEEILTTTPETRQMALFSATMPEWVAKLEKKFLKEPVHVEITAAMGGESTIEQIAYQIPHDKKMAALCTLLNSAEGESTLIFGRTKFGVERLGKQLSNLGFTVGTLHGDKSQRARENVLTSFRRGHVQTLLATNVAARGLDIQGIYQVINYELPESSELFTHRIGRTGRMGRQGKAITLLVPSDLPKWRRMTRSLGQAVNLQRLTLDEVSLNAIASARPEVALIQEIKPEVEERQMRGRGKRFESDQVREPKFEQRSARERSKRFEPDQDRERRRFVPDQEPEQYQARERKPFAVSQEHGRRVRPLSAHDGSTSSSLKRRQKERANSAVPAYTPDWQPEGGFLPERPTTTRTPRENRSGVAARPGLSRNPARPKARAYAAAEPQYRSATRSKSRSPQPLGHGARPNRDGLRPARPAIKRREDRRA